MLEIFERFVENSDGNEWLLYFEDDVRPVNIDKEQDLNYLYNIPKDAEMIRPYIGKNKKCDIKDIKYSESFGGGYTHAFYISTLGCKKVLHYVKKYKWKWNIDADLFIISKFYIDTPTGYDGWSKRAINGSCDIHNEISEDEKIAIYHTSHILFNQTSLPCASFN